MPRSCKLPAYRKHGTALRALSAVLVGLFVIGKLALLVHLAVVAHGLCPDDGELRHNAEVHSRVGSSTSLSRALPALQASCDCAQSDEHDHCYGATQRHERGLHRGPTQDARIARSPEIEPLLGSAGLFTEKPLPILRLAPKHSPPARRVSAS
jgi:hypothetical protein